MSVHDTQNPESREDALAAAVEAVRGGGLIVLPTDTVYGIGADAFTPQSVQDLLEAKGRGRDTPPPVLIGDHAVLMALATDLPDYVEDLTDALWPGALTVILTAQPSLTWDLGETRGTVALRMPEDETALEENMTFHLICGMWMTGYGYEVSETIRVTSTGVETFTSFPRQIIRK